MGPAAGGHEQPSPVTVGAVGQRDGEAGPVVAHLVAATPVRIVDAVAVERRLRPAADDSGSSIGSRRSSASTTRDPYAEPGEHLGQLQPDRAAAEHDQRRRQARPPRSPRGSSSSGVPASPSIGGIAGAVPVPRRRPRSATKVALAHRDLARADEAAEPRTNGPPLPVKRSTATLSSQLSVASSRIRLATGAQSGVTSAEPAMPVDPARLGQQVGRPDHHLARHAAPVRALAADQAALDADDREARLGELAGHLLAADAQTDHDDIHLSPPCRSAFPIVLDRSRDAGRIVGCLMTAPRSSATHLRVEPVAFVPELSLYQAEEPSGCGS